jgi:hypothetical protein
MTKGINIGWFYESNKICSILCTYWNWE